MLSGRKQAVEKQAMNRLSKAPRNA